MRFFMLFVFTLIFAAIVLAHMDEPQENCERTALKQDMNVLLEGRGPSEAVNESFANLAACEEPETLAEELKSSSQGKTYQNTVLFFKKLGLQVYFSDGDYLRAERVEMKNEN